MADGVVTTIATDDRYTSAGDEAGTPTGDRRFRPDVQGLRALAILLVVLFHADIPGVTGGYVGVDVFFVISGFVITGLLLREHEATGHTSIRSFYGRRARRILPAATLVIVVTVIAAYTLINTATGRDTAVDGQWAAVFLANYHFATSQTNYLASQSPPSLLQNFWSLAVEEQFYLIYPTVFLIVARLVTRASVRTRVGLLLGVTVIGSYVLSITLTAANPASAFFSPFTRAWELALGGLIAAAGAHLRRLPSAAAALISWLGLGAILVAAFTFTSATSYPGSLVALPVIGAGLIVVGGTAQPTWGVESLLRLRPFQLLGLISYSFYLWHWPILMIAAQRRGSSALPVADNLLLLVLALIAAVGTYLVVENPVRHSSALMARRWASIVLGLCLILSSLAVTTLAVRNTKPTLSGTIANAVSGTDCRLPSARRIAELRASYLAGQQPTTVHRSTGPRRLLVVGDSTACTMLPGLLAVGSTYGLKVENGAVIGCGIVSDTIAPFYHDNDNVLGYTVNCQKEATDAEFSSLKDGGSTIVLWGSTDEAGSIVDPPDGNKVLLSGTPAWTKEMGTRIAARVSQFLATGATVVLLLEPPRVHRRSGNGGKGPLDAEDRSIADMNDLLRQEAARHPGRVTTIDLASRVCPSGPPCPYLLKGTGSAHDSHLVVRPDDVHYGPAGSLWVAEWLTPRILAATKPPS